MSRLDRLKMGKVETSIFNSLISYCVMCFKLQKKLVGWEEREIALAKKPVLDQADVIRLSLMERNLFHSWLFTLFK